MENLRKTRARVVGLRARVVGLIVLLTTLALPLAADERVPPFERYPQALGAMFGEITGTGLHYHR